MSCRRGEDGGPCGHAWCMDCHPERYGQPFGGLPPEVPPDGHVGPEPERLIREAFLRFHAENPQVYSSLADMSLRLVRAGQKRLSINMLFEVLRYRTILRTRGDQFKLNNNYRAEYARKLMRENPELYGQFEIRKLHGPPVES